MCACVCEYLRAAVLYMVHARVRAEDSRAQLLLLCNKTCLPARVIVYAVYTVKTLLRVQCGPYELC